MGVAAIADATLTGRRGADAPMQPAKGRRTAKHSANKKPGGMPRRFGLTAAEGISIRRGGRAA
jgi:hypothetical protein